MPPPRFLLPVPRGPELTLPDNMIPLWWQDVHELQSRALADWEGVLDRLEAALYGENDSLNLQEWDSLLSQASQAARLLSRGSRLASAREHDARGCGLWNPARLTGAEDEQWNARLEAAREKAARLGERLRKKMEQAGRQLSGPRLRRRAVVHQVRPSHIDIQV